MNFTFCWLLINGEQIIWTLNWLLHLFLILMIITESDVQNCLKPSQHVDLPGLSWLLEIVQSIIVFFGTCSAL
jgi:hypothetical protein